MLERPPRGGAALLEPGDSRYDHARLAWNLTVDQRPAAVALPADAEGVCGAIRHARARGLRVAMQGTGHAAAPLGPLGGTMLVSTAGMREVWIAPEKRRMRVEAGAIWAEATAVAAEHGLAALAGSSPDVGVVGYTLGGGASWLVRRYGLACNRVVAIEAVTAAGRPIRCDHDTNDDLFWAMRGGGGSFAAVTALEFELIDLASLEAGALFWPLEAAGEVLTAWAEWTLDLPEELTSAARMLRFPPLPEVPEPMRGQSFTAIEVAHLGTPAETDDLLAPLRALRPAIDTVATTPASQLHRLHMDPDHPVPAAGDGMLLRGFGSAEVEALVDAAGAGSRSTLVALEVRHLGGAAGRDAADHGACARIDAPYAEFAVGIAPDGEALAHVESDLDAIRDALAAGQADRAYMNFCERPTAPGRLFAPATLRRLQAVKAAHDPDDLFRSNHPIPPAAVVEHR